MAFDWDSINTEKEKHGETVSPGGSIRIFQFEKNGMAASFIPFERNPVFVDLHYLLLDEKMGITEGSGLEDGYFHCLGVSCPYCKYVLGEAKPDKKGLLPVFAPDYKEVLALPFAFRSGETDLMTILKEVFSAKADTNRNVVTIKMFTTKDSKAHKFSLVSIDARLEGEGDPEIQRWIEERRLLKFDLRSVYATYSAEELIEGSSLIKNRHERSLKQSSLKIKGSNADLKPAASGTPGSGIKGGKPLSEIAAREDDCDFL